MVDMTKRERVMAAVRGEPVDRVPVSFFQHNHSKEQAPDVLAYYMLQLNRKYDWDFIKIQSRNSYYAEAWGCNFQWSPERGPEMEDYIIKDVDDFEKLEIIAPTQGAFAQHVEVARLLRETLSGSVPYVQTTLSPLAVATRLAGSPARTSTEPDRIKEFMGTNPKALHQGLSVIAQTLAGYARASVRAGADGVLLTTSAWASRDTITEEQYEIFGKPYDVMVFEAASQEGGSFNILHICRDNVMFDLLSDYPVQVINWDACSPSNPTLKQALNRTDKAVWGGINQKGIAMLRGPIEEIKHEVNKALCEVNSALEETGSKRFLLGPGCVIPPQVPGTHLDTVMETIHDWQKR